MNNYTIYHSNQIGKGTFGSVFLGLDKNTKKIVAVKVEKNSSKSVLKKEYGFLRYLLEKDKIASHIIIEPLLYSEKGDYFYMITNLYGPNLDLLHKQNNKKINDNTMILLASQMLNAISFCHKHSILHRDIKPANFMVDFYVPHTNIYLGDFGLSKKYTDGKGQHIPYQSGTGRVGSMRYMSKYTHRGIESSCRDDLYSFCYMVSYMSQGILPWTDKLVNNELHENKHNLLYTAKTSNTNIQICSGITHIGLRQAVTKCLNHIDILQFSDKPDYHLIKHWFDDLSNRTSQKFLIFHD